MPWLSFCAVEPDWAALPLIPLVEEFWASWMLGDAAIATCAMPASNMKTPVTKVVVKAVAASHFIAFLLFESSAADPRLRGKSFLGVRPCGIGRHPSQIRVVTVMAKPECPGVAAYSAD
jgi:hypothetical protein